MDRVLRFPEVRQITGLSRTTIWEQERAGRFPKHLQLTARSVGWRESDIHQWMQALSLPEAEPARRPNLRSASRKGSMQLAPQDSDELHR